MKKIFLSAFVFSLLLTNAVFAEEISCIKVIQAAVGPSGECQEYSTPCDVPENWRFVTSCEAVKDINFGLTVKAASDRRYKLKMQARSRKSSNRKTLEDKVSAKYRRIGGGSFTRSTKNTSLKREGGTKISDRKFTTPNFSNRKSYSRYKTLNSKRKYNTERTELLETSGTGKAGTYRPGIKSSVSDVFREGQLTNGQNWEDQQKGRIRNIIRGKNPYSLKAKIKRIPKRRVYEGPKLKQTYKGELMQGNLNGTVLND